MVRLKGIWVREAPTAVLARLYTSPEGQLRSLAASPAVINDLAALDYRKRRSTEQERSAPPPGTIGARGRNLGKRKVDEEAQRIPERKSFRTERILSRTRRLRKTYGSSSNEEEKNHGVDSDDDPVKTRLQRPRNLSPVSGAY